MADPVAAPGPGSDNGSLVQRILAVIVLLIGGMLSLPLAATFLDDEGDENWIIPAALVGVAALGFVVGWILPGLAGRSATRRRGALVGVAVGIAMMLLGVVIFFLLLSGFDGA